MGTFPGREITRGIGLYRRTVILTVFCMYLSLSALSGDVPLYIVDVMCCNNTYAGLSANSQGMLPRAHEAQ